MSLSQRASEQSIALAAAEQHGEEERRRPARALILVVFLLGFALRAGVGLWTQREGFRGDQTWRIMTQNLLVGKGLLMDRQGYITLNAWQSHRPPLFPLMMAGFMRMTGQSRTLTILLLAGISACTILVTYRLASGLFGRQVAMASASLVAVYPFFFVHDPALTESGLYCLLTVSLILLLVRMAQRPTCHLAAGAGILCALSALTRGTALPFAYAIGPWILVIPRAAVKRRVQLLAVYVLAFIVCVAPWLVRNYGIHDRLVFVVGGGRSLWMAQNELIGRVYPYQSIDTVEWALWERFSEAERAELRSLREGETDGWFQERAMVYIKAHPLQVASLAAKKVSAAYSPLMNPRERQETLKYVIHALSYGLLLIPVVIGLALSRRQWRDLSCIYLLYASFTLVSAVFWAHSRHRVFLDVYLIVFASYGLFRVMNWIRSARSWQSHGEQARKEACTSPSTHCR